MDPTKAIAFAQLIQAAYAIPAPDKDAVAPDTKIGSFIALGKILGNDLATDINPNRGNDIVSIGLVLQDEDTGDVAIVIRGTEGIWEWIHDAMFLPILCPIRRGVGFTEDGFSDIYRSLRLVGIANNDIGRAVAEFQFPKPVTTVTVTGHSLGGSLATMLAFDLAVNTAFNIESYTFASPRVGDPLFAAAYNHAVPNTFRIANRADLVPKLPFPPMYEHVNQQVDLNPIDPSNSANSLVRFSLTCEHSLTSYQFLLGRLLSGQGAPKLDPNCVPVGGRLPQGLEGLV